jgi:hypothetical protein
VRVDTVAVGVCKKLRAPPGALERKPLFKQHSQQVVEKLLIGNPKHGTPPVVVDWTMLARQDIRLPSVFSSRVRRAPALCSVPLKIKFSFYGLTRSQQLL